MKAIHLLLVTVLLTGLVSCFSEKENPLEKERREMNEMLEDNTILTVYRGMKVSLRSIPTNTKAENLDTLFQQMEKNSSKHIQKYTVQLIQKVMQVESGKTLSIKESLQLIKDFRILKKELAKTDEDNFPTLLEVLNYILELSTNEKEELLQSLSWNNSKEHLALAASLEGVKQIPKNLQIYELSRLHIPELENTEIKPISAIFKGLVFLESQWFYLSDEAFTQGIDALESGNLTIESASFPQLFAQAKVDTKEAQLLQLHAIISLLRGYTRIKTGEDEMQEKAVNDFEVFVNDAEKLGIDNELVWIAGAYVNITRENTEKAVAYLKKLEKSNLLGNKEKKAVGEIKEYVNSRESEKALNIFFDKLFIGKLVFNYFYEYMLEIDWYKLIRQSETGKKLLAIPKILNEEFKSIEENLDADKLMEKSEDLFNKVLE